MRRSVLALHGAVLLSVFAISLGRGGLPNASAAEEKAATASESKSKADSNADSKGAEASEKSTAKKVRLAHIEIKGPLPESPDEMSLFGRPGADLRKTMMRLQEAADDDSIAGIVIELGDVSGFGKLNELRSSIKRVQAKNKRVHAMIDSAMGPQYLVAAACDEIVMPESGMLVVAGIRAEYGFYKEMLAKLGIEADFMHMGDAKGAGEVYTRTEFSEPVRKNLTEMIDDLYDQIITTIATDRGLQVDDVRKAVDQGLFTAEAARNAGLIDRVLYSGEFRKELASQYNTDNLVYVVNYGKQQVDTDFSGPMGMMKLFQTMFGGEQNGRTSKSDKLALIYAIGPIMPGKSLSDPFTGQVMGSTTIVEALDKAAKNDDVKAIVMRVDSPGGSALASDLIWRATRRIDKPIVVSMGDVAGSGGYYIAMGADRIFAEPGTVTGSIGVVSGKLALQGLYDKIGMNVDTISRGKNSGMFSTTNTFTESEREAMQALMEDIYGQFTSKAAECRDMELDRLKSLAGGKVYTGRVAQRLGLIDEVGALQDAIAAAKRLAGLDTDKKVELLILPEPINPFEALFGGDTGKQREVQSQLPAQLLGLAPELIRPLVRTLQFRNVMREPAAVIMPYWFEMR